MVGGPDRYKVGTKMNGGAKWGSVVVWAEGALVARGWIRLTYETP